MEKTVDKKEPEKILVSACLLGVNCKYSGGNNGNDELVKKLNDSGACIIPVCPEQLGGLPTPRIEFEITGGDGFDVLAGKAQVAGKGSDYDATGNFLKGALEVQKIATVLGVKTAILKSKSPSCGAGLIYDGTFSKKTKAGFGVTAALLKRSGIEVKTEEDLYPGLTPNQHHH